MYVAGGEPSGKATASLICGIFFFIFPAAICAIVLGHIALAEIKRSSGRLIGAGRATAGLVLGYMGVAAIPLTLIVAAIAIPNLLRARSMANEASAVASIRMINTAESAYLEAFPKVGFACQIGVLGGNGNPSTPEAAALLDSQLASGTKSGYAFRIEGCTASEGVVDGYQIIAFPLQPGTTGRRVFCSNQSGIIKATSEENADSCLTSGTPLR